MASSKSPGSLSSSAPLRRSHTKSRKGCAQCKHSHRKCDEVFPTCAICRKRGIKCSLEATSTLDSASSKEREPLIPWVQELDLFHFFTMNTAETFSRTHDLDVWQEALPQQACRHGFLLDGILAAACSQRATLCDARTMHWTENAINYQNRALQQFKPALGSLNADNCHATFAFALLTMCTAFSLLDSDCTNQISALQGIREYLLGISIISMQVGQELRAGPLRALFQDSDGKDLSMFWESNTPENRDWSPLDEEPFKASLRDLHLFAEREPPQHRDPYADAISKLSMAFDRWQKARSLAAVTSYLGFVDEAFMALFRRRDPLALLVVAHYAILLGFIRDRWWVRNAGRRLVRVLSAHLDTPDRSLLASMRWVRSELGLEPRGVEKNVQSQPTPSPSWGPGTPWRSFDRVDPY